MHTISSNPKAPALERRPFVDTQDHLRAEMAWIELILKREMRVSMRRGGKLGPADEFAGMYVSEDEIRRYLTDAGPNGDADDSDGTVRALEDRIRIARRDMDRRATVSTEGGVDLRLPRLAHRFDLSETEIHIVLLCIAPDMDVRFHRCVAGCCNDRK